MISEFISVASGCVKLMSLFCDGDLTPIVRQIGDSHFNAAKFNIENFHTEKDQRGALQRILTQMESSYQIYKDNGEYGENRKLVLMLIMTCHKILGNDETIKKWFSEYSILNCYNNIVKDEPVLKRLVTKDDYDYQRSRLWDIEEKERKERENRAYDCYSRDKDDGFHCSML